MVKYRLKFEFISNNTESKRDNGINSIISDVENIESNTEIRKPMKGDQIKIGNDMYIVDSIYFSFEKEGEISYYNTNIILQNKREREEEEILRKIKEEREKAKAKKYDDLYKYNPDKYKTSILEDYYSEYKKTLYKK